MLLQLLLVFAAAAAAGAVNSVAGGGTLLTFPALLATGQAAIVANATSTVALWPGAISSWYGYREEIGESRRLLAPLIFLGISGGLIGSYLLLVTPTKVFDRIIPYLILCATLLFLAQEPLSRWLRARSGGREAAAEEAHPDSLRLPPPALLAVFFTAVYGGYFGAGIGIVTLAVLGMMGLRNIHRMNGLKNVYALATNGVAAAIFIAKGLVDWRVALLMAAGALFGGYTGAGIARKIGQRNVRRLIIGIGFVLTVWMVVRRG